jgi:hypothetical protein
LDDQKQNGLSRRIMERDKIPLGIRRLVWKKTNRRCWFCGDELHPFGGHRHLSFHIDHLVPVCKGGSNDPKNLVPACQYCNQRKGEMSLEEFRRLRAWRAAYFESKDAGIQLNADPTFFGEKLVAERISAAEAKKAQLSLPDPDAEAFDRGIKELFRLLSTHS